MKIFEYEKLVRKVDRLPKDSVKPVLFGLYGEVGELLTIEKKRIRETYEHLAPSNEALIEELGDILWYFSCLVSRLELDIGKIFSSNDSSLLSDDIDLFAKLGILAGELLNETPSQKGKEEKASLFAECYLSLIKKHNIDLSKIIESNKEKVSSRFMPYKEVDLPNFDEEFPKFEKLPDHFEIEFIKLSRGRQALMWNGVFVGDPLNDSIRDPDGYRYHDVFHLSYAAILHWSPVFRSLIKHKRKSKPNIDESEDGGRARVVEEGISAYVFNVAKEENFFEKRSILTFDMLKHINKMIKGFEVEKCPLSLWEKSILEGYKIFREVKANEGGVVIGNRGERKISYRELK